jgi:biotin transporter BioY
MEIIVQLLVIVPTLLGVCLDLSLKYCMKYFQYQYFTASFIKSSYCNYFLGALYMAILQPMSTKPRIHQINLFHFNDLLKYFVVVVKAPAKFTASCKQNEGLFFNIFYFI